MGLSDVKKVKTFKWLPMLLLVNIFQVLTASKVVFEGGKMHLTLLYVFAGYILLEWLYMIFYRIFTKRKSLELETIAFFLSGISLVISASIYPDYAVKQLVAIAMGLATFIILLILLRDTDRAMKLRMPIAFAAVGILGLNLVLAKAINGALNWIDIGFFSIQPSEFVKIAFIFVGAVTLEKLQSTQSLTKYVIFSIGCVGALFLMRDFGTALIFFFTFIVIAFMRSGDIRTIILICTAALLGAMLIIYFKPYVATRFSTYRHIWDFIDDQGFQQTRVLIYMASGGFFGLGVGLGKLRDVFAASTDLVFGVVCEEMGLLLGVFILLTFCFITIYAIKSSRRTSSTFYSIAAVASAAMLLFQVSLNVFGITDLLPLTGVTLPFISRGGSSMICSWALFGFIKCAGFYRYENKPQSKIVAPEEVSHDIPIAKRQQHS